MSKDEPSKSCTRITFVDIPLDGPSSENFYGHINPAFSDQIVPQNECNQDLHEEEILSESRSSWKRLQLARAKLKMSNKNSALLAGFAMVPMVELSIQDDEDDPIPLSILMTFGVITTALVAVHLSAVMIASCILPYIDSIALSETESSANESIQDSPHDKMHIFIEISWIFSNIIGLILFLVEIILLTWVKFWQIGSGDGNEPGKQVAVASTITLLICIAFFIWFAVYFYHSLADHEYERFKTKLSQIEGGFDRKRRLSIWAKEQFSKRRKSRIFGFRKKSSISITTRGKSSGLQDNRQSQGSNVLRVINRNGRDNYAFQEEIV